MTDTKDLIREIQEHTAAHGGENTATHLLVQAVMALQRQADELAAIGAGGVEPLRKINQPEPTVPDQTQDWAGMDGATAYLLIQRHADNWADAAKMMGEWLDANQRQSFDAADMATAAAQGFRDGIASLAASAGGPVAIRPDIQAVLAMLDVPVIARMSSHEGKLLKPGQEPPAFESAVPLVREWDHRRACESIIAALSRNN